MRLGVLDVGSNTVHLLVVDAHRGAHPWPAHSEKSALRLAEQLDGHDRIDDTAVAGLIDSVRQADAGAARHGTEHLLAFATSAIRDAANCDEVLATVAEETGVKLTVLTGEDEARLTFLAVRRWFGWSAGRLLVLDIGGGSLEIAAGIDEAPDLALSLPLGAGRLSRRFLASDPPASAEIEALSSYVSAALDTVADQIGSAGPYDRVAATSKTFRMLARLSGAAPSSAGPRVPRSLSLAGVHQSLGFARRIPTHILAEQDGVSAGRAGQVVAGAVVAEATMWRLGTQSVDICPWALREGVILNHLDMLGGTPTVSP